LFELAEGLAAGEVEPFVFGVGRGDAGEFAQGGPAELALLEGLGQGGQVFEGVGDAELFSGGARLVAEEAFDVFAEAGVAEVQVDGHALGGEEPASFFSVGSGALSGEAGQGCVRSLPVAGRRCRCDRCV
jgi:hypothetical protein